MRSVERSPTLESENHKEICKHRLRFFENSVTYKWRGGHHNQSRAKLLMQFYFFWPKPNANVFVISKGDKILLE